LETNFENTQLKQLDEEQTLHDVAKHLRSSLQSLEMSNEYYPLPSEVSITESCKFKQNLSSKKDIENAFLLTKRSSRMLSVNC
jgi:hypothetical protein